jgi:alginate O-acetyltransferase complex protein AlgJ
MANSFMASTRELAEDKKSITPSSPGKMGRSVAEDILLVLFVAVFLILPVALQITGQAKTSSENRNLASWPPRPITLTDYRTYPLRVTAFVDDHFGLRPQLVRWNSELRLSLGTSSSPLVAIGKNGFLFYVDHPERLLEQHTGEDVFTPGELEHWTNSILAEKHWLEQRGIAFFILIAPEKSTIYPELLPDYPQLLGSTTRLDQLMAYLQTKPGIELVDPRPELWRAKATARLYPRADSHWGPRGAFIAYGQLMQRVTRRFPNAHAVSLSAYTTSVVPMRGDLASLLNLYDILIYPEEEFHWIGRSHVLSTEKQAPPADWGWPIDYIHTDLESSPRLVVLGDSFTDYVMGPLFLYQTFRDPVYTHHNRITFNHRLIESTRPDVVVLELAERYLGNP